MRLHGCMMGLNREFDRAGHQSAGCGMDDCGDGAMLLDEQAVGFGATGSMKIVRPMPARAAAPEAGSLAAGRATDGKDGVTVGGEVGHHRGTPSGGEPQK